MNQDVSKITVPSGTYNIKDAKARADIATNTSNITSLQTKVTTNTNDISALETKVDGIQSSVDDFNNWNISYADETLTFTSVAGG